MLSTTLTWGQRWKAAVAGEAQPTTPGNQARRYACLVLRAGPAQTTSADQQPSCTAYGLAYSCSPAVSSSPGANLDGS